jgi:Xaa-Pro aminopeptidase
MKRGLVSWEKSELPPEELEARLAAVHAIARYEGVDALVLYSDVWRSNDARYLSNYMPYWNRAFVVVPREEKPILLCALSPRVYPWIKTVTVHETIIASPSPPATLFKLAAERGWKRVGVVDLEGLPADLHAQLTSGNLEFVDILRSELRPAPSKVEVQMHAHAAHMAREVLEREISTAAAAQTDHELTGRLERLLRLAGAEDVVILVSDGEGPPLPASGAAVEPHTSVVVAIEYNGHWAKVTRNVAGVTSNLQVPGEAELRELLSGPYSWENLDDAATAAVISLQREIRTQGQRLYYGDTCLQDKEGLRVL